MKETYSDFDYYAAYKLRERNVPRLTLSGAGSRLLAQNESLENVEPIEYFMCDPIPPKINLVDFMTSPKAVISDKIADVLRPMNISGIQLLNCVLLGEKEEQDIREGYWGLHIYHRIECVNRELSICRINHGIISAEKIVLDKSVLEKIPLQDRLIFRLQEDPLYQLFHKSIVDKIMAVNPSNLGFVDLDTPNDRSLY